MSNTSNLSFGQRIKSHFGKDNGLARGPIQRRFIALTLSGMLSICLIISILSFYIFRNYLQNALVQTNATSLSNLSETINTDLNSFFRIARYCQSSSVIADYVKASPDPGAVLSVSTYDRLYEEYQNTEANSCIPRVVVIAKDHFLQVCQISYSTTIDLAKAIPELPFFDDLVSSNKYDFSVGIIDDPFYLTLKKPVIPLVRPITYQFNSTQGGYLYMEMSTDLLTRQMKRYHLEEGSRLYLVMKDHYYAYDDGVLTEIDSLANALSQAEHYQTNSEATVYKTSLGGRDCTIISSPLAMNDCYLMQQISPAELQSQRNLFLLVLTGILIAIMATGLMLTYFLDQHIHKPLSRIRQKILATSAGDFSRDPSIEWNHELGEIGKGINDLSESVESLLETRLENEKQRQDLEYRVLQSQINPHFLYNTLNSIKMMASIQGASGIAEMTTALASLLRSISKGASTLIPIREELSLIRDYFTIQNYRYGGMINFEIEMDDPSIADRNIIKFTLQPLVENSIFHGLEPKGGVGTISIHLTYDNGDVLIVVADDGVGIPEDKMASILQESDSNKNEFFKEIGISNVNKRLQYEFGEKYGITVESEVGKGTSMCVRIPGGDQNV